MRLPTKSLWKRSDAEDVPTRTPTFGSLDKRLSSLSLTSAFRKKRPVMPPPPPYTDISRDQPDDVESTHVAPARDLKCQNTWNTVSSGSSSAETRQQEDVAAAEQGLMDKATTFMAPLAPGADPDGPRASPRLLKPVAVPRLQPGVTMPFTRAWAPCLGEHAVDEAAFVAFIDNLSLVCSPHPVVQVLEVAGFALQFVPLPYADGLAGALQLAAVATTALVAHWRGRRYLARLNADFFAPRGLHAGVMGTKRMRRTLGVPAGESLLLPLSEATLALGVQQRCLRRLETWAAPIRTEGLPDLGLETGLLARWASWRVRTRVRHVDRRVARGRRRAWKRHLKGKKLREGWLEKRRVKGLSWIVIRNLDDFEREREEAAVVRAANKTNRWKKVGR